MGKSCKIVKVKPLHLGNLLDLLAPETTIDYDEIPIQRNDLDLSLINNDPKLYTKIISREEYNELGVEFKAKIESWMTVESAGRLIALKPANKITFFIYTAEKVEGFMAIFTKGKLLKGLIATISKLLGTTDWYYDVTFNIHENEEVLRREFGNFSRFYTRDMDHELVKNAAVGGIRLEDSPDYRRFLEEYGGYLSVLFIDYGGLEIMLSSSGRIWSPKKEFEERKYEIIKDLLIRLEEIGVLEYH
ncbi:hypothetical protein P8X24_09815 [Pyrococcus kukulkanii]|uniref:hypothetical protein n=1 Tax=Pyrococcus kukulkanii TaxID=1609559 RepID=UPI0035626ED6